MAQWNDYIKLLAGLVSVLDPLGALGIFISLTESRGAGDRRRIAGVTALAVGAVLLVALFAGEAILRLFGIGLPSFQVAGGILILLMGITMLRASHDRSRNTPEERAEAVDKDSIAVVPMAIPLLSGPGAISTVIVYGNLDPAWPHRLLVAAVVVSAAAVVLLALLLANRIAPVLGRTGMNVVTRVMGLIIASIAVEFIAQGLIELFPILGRSA
ncbi:MarC family protein [Methylococcus sp. EFPC2]|uniref:MarC family protein n=1 Tax=Methylococcus sp. EFPC2 TaxID=2812648 RepID=UPI00196825A3|nr:MarC family protein [Methylococcus sp. EFPC2]QSA96779.1 NAAT family transporter [Methylococcus sp. EFPC2]